MPGRESSTDGVENETKYVVWRERWQALKKALQRLHDQIDALYPAETGLRKQTLLTLLTGLQDFVGGPTGFFTFLLDNFEQNRLHPPLVYPVEYILRNLLDQVGFDLDVISTAAAQRFYGDTVIRDHFRQADILAQQALQPAIDAGLLYENTRAITYMGNGARVRVVTYAPVALIAIPFSSVLVKQDLLATAHEVGHYVYWHGRFGANAPWNTLKAQNVPGWCLNWLEETFADVYGAIVAGPPIARSCQDILLDNLPEDFLVNDKEHPVAPLRPRIYGKTLAKLGGDNQLWGVRLKERWEREEKRLKATWDKNGQLLNVRETRFWLQEHEGDLSKKPLHEIMDWANDEISSDASAELHPLDKVLRAIYKNLEEVISHRRVNGWTEDLATPLENKTPEETVLYDRFTNYLKTLVGDPDDANGGSLDAKRLIEIKNELLDSQVDPQDKTAYEAFVANWTQLVGWGGWVIRGPETNPEPPKP